MSEPMHIAVAVETFDPAGGGAERSTAQIVEQLRRRGHRVTVLAGFGKPDDAETEMLAFGDRKLRNVWRLVGFSRWVTRRLTEGDFDTSLSVTTAAPAAVVQPRSGTMVETLDRNVAICRSSASRLGKRVSLQLNFKRQALLRLERKTLHNPRVRRIVAVSDYVERQLERHYGIAGDRVEVEDAGPGGPPLLNPGP